MKDMSKEMNLEKDIALEDKKAKKKFIVIMIISLIVGAFCGAGMVKFSGKSSQEFAEKLSMMMYYAAPYAMLGVTVISIITSGYLYRKSRKLYIIWNEEDEAIIDKIENNLTYALLITSVYMILAYFFFAVGFSTQIIDNSDNMYNLYSLFALLAGLIITMIFTIVLQKKIINFEKELNPGKKGSIYDMNFHKKWEESCDEWEKLMIYKSAYASYKTTCTTLIFLWLFCVIGNNIWNFGIMPVTIVSIIWLVQVVSYSLKAAQLSKQKA